MKKKVLFIITKSNWGGAQRYVFDLATQLPETLEPVVAFGGTGKKNASLGLLATALAEKGIRTVQINSFVQNISLWYELRAFFELLSIYRKEKPDIVHLNSSKAGGLGALAARIARVPTIVFTSHGLAYEEDHNIVFKGVAFLATWLTFFFATDIIAIAKANYLSIQRLWKCALKVHLIHNGMTPLAFLEKETARTALASHTFFAPSKEGLWIGAIAEYTKNKGLSYLIAAMGRLHTTEPIYLFLIGEGSERNHLAECIKKEGAEGYIYLCGFVSNAYTYMKAFDIITLPSVKEGLPYTLIEAGQAGRAVIASDVGGVSDIIEPGVSGLLSIPKSVSSLTKMLQALLQDKEERERYGKNLEQNVRTQFSLSRMVEQTVALYSNRS